MSTSCATYPFVGALSQAKEIVGNIKEWHPGTEEQSRFLNEILLPGLLDYQGIPELTSIASWQVDEINKFLADHGFTIRLTLQDGEFGIASVFTLLLEWETEGEVSFIGTDGERYDAVSMPSHTSFFKAVGYSERHDPDDGIVTKLTAKNGDSVFMTMMDTPPKSLNIPGYARFIEDNVYPISTHKGLLFPMVDMDVSEEIEWIKGFGFTAEDGSHNVVSQALQQNILKMNEKGALAKSAVAMGVMRSAALSQKPLVINRPFLVWISRPGFALPLFAAHVTPQDWKNPGDLS